VAHEYAVVARHERYHGPVFSVVSDEVTMPDGGTSVRDYLHHTGAVAVVALDDAGRVALVRQYRHAVGDRLWELPAGLLDVPGEDPQQAAARELAEEIDLHAGRWVHLLDVLPSPGYSDERIRVFLAEALTAADQPAARRHEESELAAHWVDLAAAVDMVLRGEITNATCMAGVLVAAQVREVAHAHRREITN
jgi:8-oxo-dGDP phosphatase